MSGWRRLQADGSQLVAGLPTDYMPQELAVGTNTTAQFQITGTEAAPTPIVTLPQLTFDGTTEVLVEFDATTMLHATSSTPVACGINLWTSYNGAAAQDLGRFGYFGVDTTRYLVVPVMRVRFTPGAGTHVLSVRGWTTGRLDMWGGPFGGPTANHPMALRVLRAQSYIAVPTDGVYEGAAPPGSPYHGQRWLLPADVASGVKWEFRYNATSASAYKWEFVGGAALIAKIDGAEGFNNNGGYNDAATVGPIVTLPRAGDYTYDAAANLYDGTSSSNIVAIALAINGVTSLLPDVAQYPAAGVSLALGETVNLIGKLSGRAAGDTVRIRYYANGNATNNGAARARILRVCPVRVS